MLNNKTKGILGSLLILAGCFVPLVFLNESFISILPVFGNLEILGVWSWRDISFFSINLVILPLISIYLAMKNNYMGLLITGGLSLFVVLILIAATLRLESQAYKFGGITVNYSWGWLLLIAGSIFLLLASKKPKTEEKES